MLACLYSHNVCVCGHVTGCLGVWNVSCLELALKSSGVGLRVSPTQFLNSSAEVTGRDLSVPARHCLQNSIIDEDVLLLLAHTVGETLLVQ